MALLVNYEGTYLPPQKLWYLVDGVWKEVTNVFENPAQQELALIDQERIKQDQVVAALITREADLMARIDGSNPAVPLETDPAQIEAILNEIDTIELQLSITKTEQVVLTKKLFETKAQMEYLKLVTEGEQALEKIATQVIVPNDWGVIRIAPQSTLDERLEIVIQHGLDTNDRIFNYGLVYYRLYKLNSTDQNDDINYLKDQFKRRLNKAAFELGIEPTNYIFTLDNIQNVYTEVNQFVNAGAQRIEDYLASIKDQQKFILDSIEEAKVSMTALQAKVDEGTLPTVDGKIIAAATQDTLKVPVGDVLLKYQDVTTFDQLVSTSTLQDIAAGTKDIANYPGIVKLNADASSLNEKISAVQNFLTLNQEIQKELTSGEITFNLNVLTSKKAALTPSKLLFWSSPLGDTSVGTSSGNLTYSQTYTSSGTYKFKNNEMIKLSTTYTAIINALSAGTNNIVLGVTFKSGDQPRIISVNNGHIYAYGDTSTVIPSVNQKAIINANSAGTQASKTEVNVKVNDKEQPHTKIVFVKQNGHVETPSDVILSVYQPIINGLFYANTEDSQLSSFWNISTPAYEYAFRISHLKDLDNVPTTGSFSFNAKEIPLTNFFVNNDNIISQIKEEITPGFLSFNAKEIHLTDFFVHNDNIISQIKEEITPGFLVFNPSWIPMTDFMVKNDNIIQQDKDSLNTPINAFSFNTKQTNNYLTIKNGYGQDTGYTTGASINGMLIIKPNTTDNHEVKSLIGTTTSSRENDGTSKYLDFYQKTRIIMASQTGLMIIHPPFTDDTLNKLMDSVPRMVTASAVRPFDAETLSLDKLNSQIVDIPRIVTATAVKENIDSAANTLNGTSYINDKLNNCIDGVTQVTTQISALIGVQDPFEIVNKDISSIPSPAIQLNPGVTLS